MSPEQARGDKVDARSDVYALGVLVHELITGDRPITADSMLGVLMAHIVQAPTRASVAYPALSPLLDEPILRMLEKSPDARPATAGEALAAIAAAAEQVGLVIPSGLPKLPRPEPSPDDEDLAHRSTLSERSHEAAIGRVDSSERPVRSAASQRGGVRWRWLAFGVAMGLLLIVGSLSYFLRQPQTRLPLGENGSGAPGQAPVAAPSAPSDVAPVPAQAVEAPGLRGAADNPPAAEAGVSNDAGSTVGSSPSQPNEAPAATPPRKPGPRKRKSASTSSEGIPSDLESPF